MCSIRYGALAIAGCMGFSSATTAMGADAFPSKPIRIVVAYAAGGGMDALVRAVGAQLTTQVGQTVPVDNPPGGGAIIAAEAVAKFAPYG